MHLSFKVNHKLLLGFDVDIEVATTEDHFTQEVAKYSQYDVVMISCLTGLLNDCVAARNPMFACDTSMRAVSGCITDLVSNNPQVKVFIAPPLPNPELRNYVECSARSMVSWVIRLDH